MNKNLQDTALVVTGRGHALTALCDSTLYLKSRKNRKFMGVQDELAVIAAGKALSDAGVTQGLGERAGIYLAVGHLPFDGQTIDELLEGSTDENGFSMQRLSTAGYGTLNPLLTFRCLSNMPAFHISMNFDIQGPYFVTYPGAGQFYLALEQACFALDSGAIDAALVAGVAHQRNFLVEHHFSRTGSAPARLEDAAGCLLLERAADAGRRNAPVRARLMDYEIAYEAHYPFEEAVEGCETGADEAMGAASLPVAVSAGAAGLLRHELKSSDGLRACSTWSIA
jgi:3-oxoacyl-(acyl-carrier-protein) synthase